MMKTKVLVIEDNVIALDEIEFRLINMGYEVDTAVNGSEAIEKAKAFNPDVILSDINLGDKVMDGIEAISLINKDQHIPVIYITAYDDNETLERAEITEPYAYIIKPIKERELKIAVKIAVYKSKTEKELRALNALKNKFFSIMAHDLMSPFGAIYNLTDFMYNNFDALSMDQIKDQIRVIYSAAKKGNDLVGNLINWSKSQLNGIIVAKENVNIKPFVEKIIEQLEPQTTAKEITISHSIDPNLLGYIDVNIIELVLRNLLSNAIKFTHVGGQINIMAEIVASDEKLVISVRDNGVGISEEQQQKLFRLDQNISLPGTENEQGNGLGLILCKEFILKHEGEIKITSELNKGSVFKIIL